MTTSTGRLLDAASALLGLCRERTYDGEPAMKLESAAVGAEAEPWNLSFSTEDGCEVLSGRALIKAAFESIAEMPEHDFRVIRATAASFQFNLARGIALLAIHAAYNYAIRETIRQEIVSRGFTFVMNSDYPPGDGCVSFGQCVYAGSLMKQRRQ